MHYEELGSNYFQYTQYVVLKILDLLQDVEFRLRTSREEGIRKYSNYKNYSKYINIEKQFEVLLHIISNWFILEDSNKIRAINILCDISYEDYHDIISIFMQLERELYKTTVTINNHEVSNIIDTFLDLVNQWFDDLNYNHQFNNPRLMGEIETLINIISIIFIYDVEVGLDINSIKYNFNQSSSHVFRTLVQNFSKLNNQGRVKLGVVKSLQLYK